MEKQNVTLSIPKEVLRKAKLLAVKQNTSLSGLLSRALEKLVTHEEDYKQAYQRNLEWLARGSDLGTQGMINWQREDLHER